MKVYTHFSDSSCVVGLTPGALQPSSARAYIATQLRGTLDRIEVVQGGQVAYSTYEYVEKAAERITSIMKSYALK